MIVVSNAGPLIVLAKIGRFNLLQSIFGRLIIPQAVYDEVVIAEAGRPGSDETRQACDAWVETMPVQNTAITRSLVTKLGRGESEAIALAIELAADIVLLDDGKARTVADFMGLRVSGTIGVLTQAHRTDLLMDLRQALDELRANGFRLSPEVYRKALTP